MVGNNWQKVWSFKLNDQLAMAKCLFCSIFVSMLPNVAVFSTCVCVCVCVWGGGGGGGGGREVGSKRVTWLSYSQSPLLELLATKDIV